MTIPKCYKAQQGYATNKSLHGGKDYRSIAELMTDNGNKMNHATARNIFISALCKVAKSIHSMHGVPITDERLKSTARDPRFQSGVAEILSSIKSK